MSEEGSPVSEGKHYEIERKYLIAMPDEEALAAMPGCRIWQIEQIYLTGTPGLVRRVRRVREGDSVTWYRTFKHRLNALSAEEDEAQIGREEWERWLTEADPALRPIVKTRYRVPWGEQLLEFDIFPFWQDRAILEIELETEDTQAHVPDWVRVLREVTSDRRYKNVCMAAEIPMDEL